MIVLKAIINSVKSSIKTSEDRKPQRARRNSLWSPKGLIGNLELMK
jgi:hypothetical protein